MDAEENEGGGLEIGGTGDMNDWDDMMPGDVMDDMEDVMQFIPEAGSKAIPEAGSEAIPEAGPSSGARSRHVVDAIHLDQGDDSRVEVVNTNAGWVLRMESTLHEKWHKQFGHKNEDVDMDGSSDDETDYAPFASEMDWKIANWVIKDGPGHAAFDRLLAIPDVSHHFTLYTMYIYCAG